MDDSACVLLECAFAIIVVAALQLIGWFGKWWSRVVTALFLAAIIVEYWASIAGVLGPSVQITTRVWSAIVVFLVAGILATLLSSIEAWAIGALALLGVVGGLAYGYGAVEQWSINTFDWDMPLEFYVVLLVFIGTLLLLLVWRIGSWRWLGRLFNFILITFILTEAIFVINERDPYSGFNVTVIAVFEFEDAFLFSWLFLGVLYVIVYYVSYRHIPWNSDAQIDTKDRIYSNYVKAEKQRKKAQKKEKKTGGKKHTPAPPATLPPRDTDPLLPSSPPTPPPHHYKTTEEDEEPTTRSLLYPDYLKG